MLFFSFQTAQYSLWNAKQFNDLGSREPSIRYGSLNAKGNKKKSYQLITPHPAVYKEGLISFLLSLIEEQPWTENYGQHNPAVIGSYPAENHPAMLPDQPSYYERMFS